MVIWSPGNTPPEYRVIITFNVVLPSVHFKVPAMCPGLLRTERMRSVALIQPQRGSQGQGSLLRWGTRLTDTLFVSETTVRSTTQSVSYLSRSLGTEQVGGIQTAPSIGTDLELLSEPHKGHSSVPASRPGQGSSICTHDLNSPDSCGETLSPNGCWPRCTGLGLCVLS